MTVGAADGDGVVAVSAADGDGVVAVEATEGASEDCAAAEERIRAMRNNNSMVGFN